jgi:DNA-binding transcriptional LysR family regulator
MTMLNPQRLRYFYEVLERRSIRTAAEVLNTAPSVVTRQVKLLERELGVTLFERRHKRGMAPTEAGEVLADYYKNNYEQKEQLDNHLRQIRDKERGTIYLAVGQAYITIFMEEVLIEFMHQYPKIKIDIQTGSSSSIVSKLVEDTAHIGLAGSTTLNPITDSLIHYRARVQRPTICMIVGKNHPLARKHTATLSEAMPYPLALLGPAFTTRKIIHQLASSEKIELRPTLTMDYLQGLKLFAKANYGVTFMSSFSARQEIEANELVPLEIDNVPPKALEICLMVRKGRPLSAAADELLNRTIEKLSILKQVA